MKTAYIYHPVYLAHDLAGHPENARRLESIMALLGEQGVLGRLVAVEPRPATGAELQRVHTPSYIELVRQVAGRGGGRLDADTYVSARSYDAACMAAGGLLAAVDALLAGDIDNGFALLRPPGHHALADRGMGFCLFNNVALAARHALASPQVERVLIADFDVHHGNGTQAIFDADPAVFYFSTHQYPFYPGTGHWRETGSGPGKGTVLDVPLPAGVGDQGYLQIVAELARPLARRFQPDLILVSAGYDAHWQDPLAAMTLSLTGYVQLARELIAMAEECCGGKILFTLEGGYHLDVLSHGVLNTIYALLGETTVSDPFGSAHLGEPSVLSLVEQLKTLHCLAG
ncbi:MAG: histone deacetylase [Anaerolineae bacterium]|nr:histone deacetylase [Anaerolineae bacterium]